MKVQLILLQTFLVLALSSFKLSESAAVTVSEYVEATTHDSPEYYDDDETTNAAADLAASTEPTEIFTTVVPVEVSQTETPIEVTSKAAPAEIVPTVAPVEVASTEAPVEVPSTVAPLDNGPKEAPEKVNKKLSNKNDSTEEDSVSEEDYSSEESEEVKVVSSTQSSVSTTTEDPEITKYIESNLNELLTKFIELKQKLQNMETQLHVYKSANPVPYPNIWNFIDADKKNQDLRASLKKMWPSFWKISKRKRCARLYDEKLAAMISTLKKRMENTYESSILVSENIVKFTENKLNFIEGQLVYNLDSHLERCKANIEDCELVDFKETVIRERKYIEETLIDPLNKKFISDVEQYVKTELSQVIIPAINQCLD